MNQEEERIDFTIGKYRERERTERDEYRGSAETVREWEAVRLAIEWVDWAEWERARFVDMKWKYLREEKVS